MSRLDGPRYSRDEIREIIYQKMQLGDNVYIPKDISHSGKPEHATVVRMSKNVIVFRKMESGGFFTAYPIQDCMAMSVDHDHSHSSQFVRDLFKDT